VDFGGRGVGRRVEIAAVGGRVRGFVFANFVFAGGGSGSGRLGGLLAKPLELEEIAKGPGVGAAEPGFHTVEDGERVVIGEPFEGAGEGLSGRERVVGVVLFVGDGVGKELGFDEGDAVETPLGGDDFVDQVEFDGAIGLELLDVGGEEGVELGGVFGGEDEGLGSEAMKL